MLSCPHLCGYDSYEKIPSPEGSTELPSPLDVFVQRLTAKLDKDIDGKYAAIDQIRQSEVYDPIFGGEMYGWFSTMSGQWRKSLSPTPCKNYAQHSPILAIDQKSHLRLLYLI